MEFDGISPQLVTGETSWHTLNGDAVMITGKKSVSLAEGSPRDFEESSEVLDPFRIVHRIKVLTNATSEAKDGQHPAFSTFSILTSNSNYR